MNRNDITRMAEEAGGMDMKFHEDVKNCHGLWVMHVESMERFAALVAAAEREACAKECENTTETWAPYLYSRGCTACAKAIRARDE